jgi:hypothetical protein
VRPGFGRLVGVVRQARLVVGALLLQPLEVLRAGVVASGPHAAVLPRRQRPNREPAADGMRADAS